MAALSNDLAMSGVDLEDVEQCRPLLEQLCRLPGGRTNPPGFDLARNRWHPLTVTHPLTLSRYSDGEAWEFIADCFRDGVKIVCRPPCAEFKDHAYVMVAAPEGGGRRIYMKVVIRPGVKKIIGVSFHYELT